MALIGYYLPNIFKLFILKYCDKEMFWFELNLLVFAITKKFYFNKSYIYLLILNDIIIVPYYEYLSKLIHRKTVFIIQVEIR